MKTIGIIIREFSENNKSFIGVREDLFDMLIPYNVNVIGIPIKNDFYKTKEILNFCDGVILSGGSVFLENDFLLVDYLYKKDIPVLGICLGMQGMARYFSLEIEKDISNHLKLDNDGHFINIEKDSLLYKILNSSEIFVNSRHKSAIIATTLDVVARSADDTIEAVEDKTKRFFLGVQWHPESLQDINTTKLIEYFIKKLDQ